MKVIYLGPAKPDDPIYKTGPVVGGIRIGHSSKTGEHASKLRASKPAASKPVFTRIDASMSRERAKRNLVDALEKSGFRVVKTKDGEA